MKPKIHPPYKELKVEIGKDVFVTMSTLPSEKILMDIDYRKHPAWSKDGSNMVNQSNKSVADFNKKFGSISFGKSNKKKDPENLSTDLKDTKDLKQKDSKQVDLKFPDKDAEDELK